MLGELLPRTTVPSKSGFWTAHLLSPVAPRARGVPPQQQSGLGCRMISGCPGPCGSARAEASPKITDRSDAARVEKLSTRPPDLQQPPRRCGPVRSPGRRNPNHGSIPCQSPASGRWPASRGSRQGSRDTARFSLSSPATAAGTIGGAGYGHAAGRENGIEGMVPRSPHVVNAVPWSATRGSLDSLTRLTLPNPSGLLVW
jgi:hypothetical protein